MKRIVSIIMVLLMLGLTACAGSNIEQGSSVTESKKTDSSESVVDDSETDGGSNVLVVYFSNTGTTERTAKMIVESFEVDLYQIIAKDPYTDEDRDYTNNSSRCNREQADVSVRPEIDGTIENMEQYDVIFIGYPIWHGQAPRIISTFLESYDFDGKVIVPFCTSHSSGIGSSAEDLHLLANNADWKDGQRFSAETTTEEIQEWVASLDIDMKNIKNRETGKFDFGTKTVLLNSGYEMPIVGLGTYSLSDEECYNSVMALLENGGRLIDTAYMYHNEEAVGRAVRDSGIPRDEIFVMTKIYPTQYDDPEQAIEEAFDRLALDMFPNNLQPT